MTSFNPSELSPVLILSVTILLAAAGGLLPFSPLEPVLVLTAIAHPRLVLPAVALATLSQMGAKSLLFAGSGKVLSGLSGRKRQAIDRVRARLEGKPALQTITVLASAASGLPPLYVVTLVCGALRLRLRDYFVAGCLGRAARFTVIMLLAQLL